MSNYDTIERTDDYWVRVYDGDEPPEGHEVLIEVGDIRFGSRSTELACLSPSRAVELATALMTAARRSIQRSAKVAAVLSGTPKENTMSTNVAEAIVALNDATNHIAAEITALRARLGDGSPVTPVELAQLDALAVRLEGLAADPANVVP